jgi:hypothetical protein
MGSSLAVKPIPTQPSLSVQPIPKQSLGNYSVAKSPDGGWNYFFNGKPITREAYASGSGKPYLADPAPTTGFSSSNTAPANPNNTGGSGGTHYEDKSNDIALQTAGLGAVDTQTNAGLTAVDKALAGLYSTYDAQTGKATKTYNDQSDSNQTNLQTNKQSALLNAAQGRRGLFGTLASLGALNGSGIDLANGAVQAGANEDLSGAASTFATNKTNLDGAIEAYKEADAERRQHAADAADNNKRGVRNQAAQTRQSFYSNLANDFQAEGNTGQAKHYTDLAASLYPEIASTTIPTMSLTPESAAFTPTSLANYLSANNTLVSTTAPAGSSTGPSGLPGLVASTKRKNS